LNGNIPLSITMVVFVVVLPTWRYVSKPPQAAGEGVTVARKQLQTPAEDFPLVEMVDWSKPPIWRYK